MNSPLISVVVPTYNHSRYIKRALKSIWDQAYQNYEIIVVDDGSTDNTKEILKDCLDKIKYVDKTNGGLSSARNVGLTHVTGDFIQFLDADDSITVNKFDCQLKLFARNPEMKILASRIKFLDAQGRFLSNQPAYRQKTFAVTELIMGNPFAVHALLFRRECFLAPERFDEQLRSSEDWDMWLRLSTRYQFHAHNDLLANYFRGSDTMRQNASRMCHHHFKVLKKSFHALNLDKTKRHETYARGWLKCAAGFYSNNEPRRGRRCFRNALKIYPEFLTDINIFLQFEKFFKSLGFTNFIQGWDSTDRIEQELTLTLQSFFKECSAKKILAIKRMSLAAMYAALAFQRIRKGEFSKGFGHAVQGLKNQCLKFAHGFMICVLKWIKADLVKK